MKVWSLRWNTLSDRSILPEMICQEKIQPSSKTDQKTRDRESELQNTVAVGDVRYTFARYFNRVWRSREKNAVDLSRGLLNKFGTLKNIDQASITDIC